MPDRHSEEYHRGFYGTAKQIYEKIVVRSWPDAISISEAVDGDYDLSNEGNEYF